MPTNHTYKIRDLSCQEKTQLKQEISSIDDKFWIKHFKIPHRLLSLRDGETIHINWPADNIFQQMPERPELVPEILDLINNIISPNQLGRAYIHRLKPGDCIEKHSDQIHVKNLNIQDRYHIYFDIPESSVLYVDDSVIENKKQFENSIVNFALSRMHYYKNYSDQNWYFLVFDKINQ